MVMGLQSSRKYLALLFMATTTVTKIICAHCGDDCTSGDFRLGDRQFCCIGCRSVYQLLDRNGLCEYYQLNERPGMSRVMPAHREKFAFLDDEKLAARFIIFQQEEEVHIKFHLPQMHCSSCLYLLENLHRLHAGIVTSRVDFEAREITVVIQSPLITIRQLAELLEATGYEPYVSLHDLGQHKPTVSRSGIYRLGVAGFCFANIMLLSFPEYLGLEGAEPYLRSWFRTLNLVLSLPVFFYSAWPFYVSAWKGLSHKWLNIDAPIVLAIFVTFGRSLYEIATGTGAGYFDSMTGIIFFMLAGRMLQDRTQRRLSFDRDYTSWFPIAVSVLKDGTETPKSLPDIRVDDTLVIRYGELIPADGILVRGQALIDYSFVTGEAVPVPRDTGELVYAGGRQMGAAIEVLVVREVTQSHLTQLWNKQEKKPERHSYIDFLSRWFTYFVFTIAAATALYWALNDPSRIGASVTAVLIVACPCALLLSSTFTNGNILSVLANNGFYLRSARVIETMAATSHIVFDKTGTLTTPAHQDICYNGMPLSAERQRSVSFLASQSAHPLSKALVRHLGHTGACQVTNFKEEMGKGVEGYVDREKVSLGTLSFVEGQTIQSAPFTSGTRTYIAFDHVVAGYYFFPDHYREGLEDLMRTLGRNYELSLISGDNPRERDQLRSLMGKNTPLLFRQSPEGKRSHIEKLQQQGHHVMMLGDGLNDAGALRQSDTGIAVAAKANAFTPASHAILEADRLTWLPKFIHYCRLARNIVMASFILSICYNVIGLSFAVQGILSPLVAAILMPASSLSILIVTYGSATLAAKALGLRRVEPTQLNPHTPA